MNYNVKIIIPDIFEGNLKEWEDCFFSFSTNRLFDNINEIYNYCQTHKFSLKISFEVACEDNLLPDGPFCPKCGERRWPSGIDGGSWVHY